MSVGCKKDEPIKEEEETKTTYTVEVKFSDLLNEKRVVTLNGVELNTYTFSAQNGDVVKVDADNMCAYDPFTGAEDCPRFDSFVSVDGTIAEGYECYCSNINYSYTLK
jgi:hypothetical protein